MSTDIWHGLSEVPKEAKRSVVTLGNFDGVHRGHRAVLDRVVEEARARGDRAIALTFDPHPLAVHHPDHPPTLICGLDDRLDRMAESGLDAILVVRYSLEFAQQTAQEFVRTYIAEGLRASGVVIGHDTKFGRGNAGHADTMRELGEAMGFTVEVMDWAGSAPGAQRRYSSTWVRELLNAGDVAGAAKVLGEPHRLRGVVVHGDALGRTIGFPTANLAVDAGMIPANGVYAGWLTIASADDSIPAKREVGRRLPVAISVGVNVTVGGTELRVEAHVIDAEREDLDLYGAHVALDFADHRREMKDFGSVEALTVALGEDVEWCRGVLGLR